VASAAAATSLSSSSATPASPHGGKHSMFGKFKIPNRDQVFYASEHCLGIVNLKPIVPGHILVVPKRVLPRVSDLTDEEAADLMKSVRKIGPRLERHYEATALNIAIQDGKDSGQSVPHVHVHILPRKPKDIEPNDKVYDEIENWSHEDQHGHKKEGKLEVPPDEDRKPRTMKEMRIEAEQLRTLFPENQPEL